MAVYSLDNINNEYISFEEAVISLLESYSLTLEEAVLVVEDYIEEANKDDARRASHKGERIYTQKKQNRLVGNYLNEPGSIPMDRTDYGAYEDAEEYIINNRVNTKHFNKVKPKTEKEKIRDATRTMDSIVPKHGANPKYSKDADPKAVEAYIKSTKKNPYKKYDIDKSVKNMDAAKARIVKDRMERGDKLPENIKKSLVKKKDDRKIPGKLEVETYDNIKDNQGYKTFTKKFDNPEDFYDIRNNFKKMRQTTDPYEFHINRKQFLDRMGLPKNNGDIIDPSKGYGPTMMFSQQQNPAKRTEKEKEEEYIHVSKDQGIKELSPSTKTRSGKFFAKPRVYLSKGQATDLNGTPLSKDDIDKYNLALYKTKFDKNADIYKDRHTIGDPNNRASYVVTNKPIKVEKVKDDSDKEDKKSKK